MGIELEKWVQVQGWEKHTTAKGQTYYCRKFPKFKPRIGLFDDGSVVIGWHDRGYIKTVTELVYLMLEYDQGEEVSV